MYFVELKFGGSVTLPPNELFSQQYRVVKAMNIDTTVTQSLLLLFFITYHLVPTGYSFLGSPSTNIGGPSPLSHSSATLQASSFPSSHARAALRL
jgi:hypothetical protein